MAGELYGRGKQLTQNLGEPISEGEAIEQFAQAVHSNPETVRQALFIEEKAQQRQGQRTDLLPENITQNLGEGGSGLAQQRRLSTLKQGDIIPDTQNFGERENGEAVEQFATAVHSNPEANFCLM